MNQKKNEQGFSLVEILIAMTLLGITIVGFLTFLSSIVNTPRMINDNTIALNLARDRIEFLRQFENTDADRNNSVWNTQSDGTIGTNPVSYSVNKSNIQFSITSNVHPINDASIDSSIRTDTDFIPVTVTVSWKSKGIDRSISSTTLFSKKY
jgi:prepilin-type N-terminal cleavage/methylation domain-containing protein